MLMPGGAESEAFIRDVSSLVEDVRTSYNLWEPYQYHKPYKNTIGEKP